MVQASNFYNGLATVERFDSPVLGISLSLINTEENLGKCNWNEALPSRNFVKRGKLFESFCLIVRKSFGKIHLKRRDCSLIKIKIKNSHRLFGCNSQRLDWICGALSAIKLIYHYRTLEEHSYRIHGTFTRLVTAKKHNIGTPRFSLLEKHLELYRSSGFEDCAFRNKTAREMQKYRGVATGSRGNIGNARDTTVITIGRNREGERAFAELRA